MFWIIVFILAWYNTGLLCCLWLCWEEHQEGIDQTIDDFKSCLIMSFFGWFVVLLVTIKLRINRGKNRNQQAKVILKGKGRE